jgi:DNA-binding PadR family transcriptional regulator
LRLFDKLHELHNRRHSFREDRRFARGPHHHDHQEHHERHERHFGRGGRLARLLEHGDLKLLVLHLIKEQPRHGYEIIKEVEDLTGGAYAPSPGVIYPTLTLLEELGQATATAEGSRKSYAITAAGAQLLADNQPALTAILSRIAAAQPREASMPVLRAMENLKTALRMKFGAQPMPPETARKVADALDAVARTIEEF